MSDPETTQNSLARLLLSINKDLEVLAPIPDLFIRVWVAWVFFKSGLTKTTTANLSLFGSEVSYPTSLAPNDTTIMLFQYEYSVPLLDYTLAAQLGTAAELILPIFLILGFAGRYAAIALFIFNIVAVISYPDLQAAGLRQHQLWGIMLLVTVCHGPGKISLDHLIKRAFQR